MPEENVKPKKFGSDYYNERYYTERGFRGWYDKQAFSLDNQFHKQIVEMIVDVIQPKNSVALSIGCALGNVVYWLNKMGINAFGVDISEYAIKNSHIPEKVMRVDITEGIPFPDGHFDYIFSRETLEHIAEEEISAVLKEIYRVMKTGGVGFLLPANNFCGKEDKKQISDENADISHLCIKSPYWWAKKCEEAGFIVDYERSMYAQCTELAYKYFWTTIVMTKIARK